jgi:hypothetical protein
MPLKCVLQEWGVDWIHLARDRTQWKAVVKMTVDLLVKVWNFLPSQLSDCHLLTDLVVTVPCVCSCCQFSRSMQHDVPTGWSLLVPDDRATLSKIHLGQHMVASRIWRSPASPTHFGTLGHHVRDMASFRGPLGSRRFNTEKSKSGRLLLLSCRLQRHTNIDFMDLRHVAHSCVVV